ncbi:F-box/FBD/LRR-repeat protein At4g00160-like [Silene latifolia]|uniref:F-box/FBD/LRR-repeat protein At4g00160-like n=1 Tax=Silene latifolia TaxID=37657 RepID=UPI003D787749
MVQHDFKRAATENNFPKINIINNDILCYILTFLPLNEAVRTSILARRWRNLWKFNPNLIVEYRDHKRMQELPNSDTIISNLLDSHKTKLKCCQIYHSASDVNKLRVLQWIKRLKESHHVQDLALQSDRVFRYDYWMFGTPVFGKQLSAPSKLFGSQTLQVLKLSQYILRDGSAFEGCVNLTTLKLQDVKLFSSTTIAEIISNCPRLTSLSLINCVESKTSTWKDLRLCSDKLEYLELRQGNRIYNLYIDAVRLHTLVLEFQMTVWDSHINTPLLATFRLVDGCGSRFLSFPIGFQTAKRCNFTHKGLENVRYLSVVLGVSYQSDTELLCRIFQVCLHLKELHIINYERRQVLGGPVPQENIRENDEPLLFWDDDKIEGKVSINLRALEVSMFRADRLEMEFVRYVMSYADLESLVIHYDKSCSIQVVDAANQILLSHPRASGTAAISLRLNYLENMIIQPSRYNC